MIIHILVATYMFVGLAIVCDDFFVPALTRVSDGRYQHIVNNIFESVFPLNSKTSKIFWNFFGEYSWKLLLKYFQKYTEFSTDGHFPKYISTKLHNWKYFVLKYSWNVAFELFPKIISFLSSWAFKKPYKYCPEIFL